MDFFKHNNLKVKEVRGSIVAIGFFPTPNQVTIQGSGFCISNDGKILTAAHLYNQLNEEQRKKMRAFVMVERKFENLERYDWKPISLVKKNDISDFAIFQLDDYKNTFLRALDFGNSEKVGIGQKAYFIGFPYAGELIHDGFGVTLIVNRTIISSIKHDINLPHARVWFFVDAISNPGNSGSPLIDVMTNKVIGVMTISFATKSKVSQNLDIREPMHIAGAKPINLAKDLLNV